MADAVPGAGFANLLADAVGVAHAAFLLFVIGGQALVLAGWARGWRWTRNRVFRRGHLAAIGVVVAIDLSGNLCPLTTLEWHLRQQAGELPRAVGFIEYWLEALLYYDGPGWLFTLGYVAFGALVALSYWRYPPARPNGQA